MENKIQELTDKIYREGVEKGNEEAQKPVSYTHLDVYKRQLLHPLSRTGAAMF